MRVLMELHTKKGSNLYFIYGNESWNDRSSCLDLKLEINNNALWMGIDCDWEYATSSLGVSKSSQRKIKILRLCKPQYVLKKFREPSRSSWGEAMCSQNICEYWGGVGKLAGWCNPRWQKLVMHCLKSVLLKHSLLINCKKKKKKKKRKIKSSTQSVLMLSMSLFYRYSVLLNNLGFATSWWKTREAY